MNTLEHPNLHENWITAKVREDDIEYIEVESTVAVGLYCDIT